MMHPSTARGFALAVFHLTLAAALVVREDRATWQIISTYEKAEVAPGKFVGHINLDPDVFYGGCMDGKSDLFIFAVNFTNAPAALLFTGHRQSLCPPHPLLDGFVRTATGRLFIRGKLITRELLFFLLVGLQWFWIGKYSLREGGLRLRVLPVWIISAAGLGLAVLNYYLEYPHTDPSTPANVLLVVILGTWLLWAIVYFSKAILSAAKGVMKRYSK